jgi:alpha-methylacyl-CoA racemase
MVDGSALLMSLMHGLRLHEQFDEDHRGANILDGGAPYYDAYECADGEYVSIGAIEPQFWAELLRRLELTDIADRDDPANWPAIRARLEGTFRSRTRSEWCDLLEGTDTCFAPVLRMREATEHPHNVHRHTFVDRFGALQPAPAPRFSRTAGDIQGAPAWPGQHTDDVLRDCVGASDEEIAALRDAGTVA